LFLVGDISAPAAPNGNPFLRCEINKHPPKTTGHQLALDPLDGQGIAGYVPEP
jgi:hypothetical protein